MWSTVRGCSVVDRRSGKWSHINEKTNYIESTLLSFLKVCLYGSHTNCQFYWISLFHQLNTVFHKFSKNHFIKDCIFKFTWSSLKLTWALEIAFKYFIWKKCFLKYIIQYKHIVLNFTYISYEAHMQSFIFTWKWFSVILSKINSIDGNVKLDKIDS